MSNKYQKNIPQSKSLPSGEVGGAVNTLLAKYSQSHQNPANKLVQWVCIPLMVFSLLGLVWAIPFPYIKFLGQYNGFVNWASFLIAFSVYYYYKLSPVLSYCMLLIIFAFSYGIIQLEQWQKAGGPHVWQICLVLFIAACIVQLAGNKIEGKKAPFLDEIKFLLIGPVWLLHFMLKKLKVKY